MKPWWYASSSCSVWSSSIGMDLLDFEVGSVVFIIILHQAIQLDQFGNRYVGRGSTWQDSPLQPSNSQASHYLHWISFSKACERSHWTKNNTGRNMDCRLFNSTEGTTTMWSLLFYLQRVERICNKSYLVSYSHHLYYLQQATPRS